MFSTRIKVRRSARCLPLAELSSLSLSARPSPDCRSKSYGPSSHDPSEQQDQYLRWPPTGL